MPVAPDPGFLFSQELVGPNALVEHTGRGPILAVVTLFCVLVCSSCIGLLRACWYVRREHQLSPLPGPSFAPSVARLPSGFLVTIYGRAD